MDQSPRLSERTPAELLARAADYRRMAETASTADVRDALLRLAERLEAMAARRSPDAIDKKGKPLSGAAKTSFLKKCMSEA
jgi:hypothetical protein